MITGIIYKYTSPSNKIYVGKTINESERKHAFLTKERYAGIKIDNARAKYGPKNFKYDVIERHEYSSVEEATESLNILEAYYIGLYNSLVKGYNMSLGGEGSPGYHLTPEQVDKCRIRMLNNNPFKGKAHTEKTKRIISEANSKAVIQLDPISNEIISEYSSALFMSGHTRNNHSSNDDYHLMYGSAYDSNRHHDISSSFNPERSRGGLFERFNRMSDSLTEEDMYEIMKMAREKKNSGNEHFNESYAKYLVSNMYHYEGGRKYVGEKFSMAKAKEVCERYRGVIPQSFTHADVYVAINEHYHNCSELFKSWFGEDIDQKVIEAAILYWFKDDDCKSNSKLWNHFKEN